MTPSSAPRPSAPPQNAQTITVVVNVYAEEPAHLREALRSVFDQTRRPEEVVVVEDGAKQDYGAVYAEFPGVRVIAQPNAGLAAARNAGWRAATGALVCFLDGDDRLAPAALETNVASLAAHPDAAFAFGGYRFVDRNGRPTLDAIQPQVGDNAWRAFLRQNVVGMHATVLYRRSAIEAAGGFAEDLRACEDYDLYLRLARRHPVAQSREILADYRRHDENMSNDLPMMMRTALAVLERHRAEAERDPQDRTAHQAGIRFVKTFYSGQQLLQARDRLVAQGPGGVPVRNLLAVWREAPVDLPRIAAREIVSRARTALSRGRIDMGSLDRATPVSRHFGYDRGTPVDRRYIEQFLEAHRADIQGRVLEVGDNAYTRQFGGERVTLSEVVHISPDVPGVTYVADLADGVGLPSDTFDCVICTQTIHLIFDIQDAVRTLHRILKPGGVLLITVPGVSSVDGGEWGGNWLWSLTQAALDRLLGLAFRKDDCEFTTYGNVYAAVAFLHGLAQEEVDLAKVDARDGQYPMIVAARAAKRADAVHGA